MANALDEGIKAGLPFLGLGGFAADGDDKKSPSAASTDPGNALVVPSAPLSGFLGETKIAGQKVGLHMTSRGVIGGAYVALGIGLAIVGLVFIIGGLNETRSLVRGVSRGII